MEWLIGLLALIALIAALVWRERPRDPAFDSLRVALGQLQGEMVRFSMSQDELRTNLQRGREASVLQLSQAVEGIRGDLSRAHSSLAEVKALEAGRAQQMDQAATSLRRLEAIVAGSSTRGTAGENILARSLSQLPADLLEVNVPFGSRIVEYALRLPNGRLLPIDSKWTSAASLEKLAETDDPQEQRKLCEQVARDVRMRIREMGKYLDPERTLSIALLAVPDAVYAASAEAHGEGYREGILVVPYSLTLPFVLSLYRLTLRFGSALDTDQLSAHLRCLESQLRKIEEDLEGRLSRGLVQVGNARDQIREALVESQRICARLLGAAEGEGLPPASDPSEPKEALGVGVGRDAL